MVVQSAINQVQVLATHTVGSPLSVPLSSIGSALAITIMVTNVGVSRFLVRGKAGTNYSAYTSLAEGEMANIVLEGTATDAVSLEFYRSGSNPRFISMYDTVLQDIPAQAKIERYD
jgi:hypothetical protein